MAKDIILFPSKGPRRRVGRPRKNLTAPDGSPDRTREWNEGDLSFLLDENQLSLRESFYGSVAKKYIWNCSRQIGKSFLMCVLAIESAIRQRWQIKYAAPTAKMVRQIIRPHFRDILFTCPIELRPEFHTQEGEWRFKNGSCLTVAGCDRDNADNLRGQHAHCAFVDEAGFIDQLSEVINDILMPQTLNTNGRLLICSSPAKTPGHYFKELCDEAEGAGAYQKRTIYQNPRLSEATIVKYMREAGGAESTTWKREYLAEHVTDIDIAIIPEATEERLSEITREVFRPNFFDSYVAFDFGFSPDFTGVLFAYWWFEEATLVIEDELILKQMSTDKLASDILAKEKELWGEKKVYLHCGDVPTDALLADMASKHNLYVVKTEKYDKEAHINHLRQMVKGNMGSLIIHPRCKALRRQMRNAVWNKTRTSFERSTLDGHYDLLDALIYLARNINRQKNPVPKDFGFDPNKQFRFIEPDSLTKEARAIKGIFTF